ncbi:pseudopaline transport inner membrane protein CntI [Methylothermus subterraneus]
MSWIVWALVSAASFAGMAAVVRHLSAALPQAELVFFRNALALLFLLPLLIKQGVSLRTPCFGLHLLRAGSGLAAMYLYFYALARLPLADALLLNYTSPLFLALFATLWLRERWTRTRIAAWLLGAGGLGLVFQPSAAAFSLAGLTGLASGALAGLALTAVKRMAASEPSTRIVTWFALLSTLISALPLLVGPTLAARREEWLWLLAMGLLGSLGQLGITRAVALAPASQVSPLTYSSLLFAGLIGYLLWGERPNVSEAAGMGLILAAGVLVGREPPSLSTQ